MGGQVELWGRDAREGQAVAHALHVGEDDDSRHHIHGFHTYPARLHPITARRLVEALSQPGALVLDPFCGSGTVLVEARLAGRRGAGVDANPLAVQLAQLKTEGFSPAQCSELLAAAQRVVATAEDRRARRAGATRRYPPDDTSLFDPHVLLELDGLRAGMASTSGAPPRVQKALALVLSSILMKVSRRPGDTSSGEAPRRLASGYTVRLYLRKAEELTRLLTAFTELLPKSGALPPPPAPTIRLGDARKLDGIAESSVDLVVTSPPYPGNYDYLAHHAVRLRWLDLDAEGFAQNELGARRHLEPLAPQVAVQRWSAQLSAVLVALRRVLVAKGKVVLVLADSVIGQRAVYADRLVKELAPKLGLSVTTIASQARPHFHGQSARAFDRAPRREHAIVLAHATHPDGYAAAPLRRPPT